MTRFGRYELVGRLGRGGMAEVFLARYRGPAGFEKRLVIKRVLPSKSGDRRFLRLFFDEARTQVSLSHGNLVPVFDFGRVGNSYFIAMEHVPGRDLGTLLDAARARGEALPPALVAYIGAEVCRGLAYVHRRGFVHRDVAPRNVLLSTEGEVKLSDFGIALAAESDAASDVRGTLATMAPEQARGERIDGRADLFALGMVLGEALLGRRLRPPADNQEAALAAAREGRGGGDELAAIVDGPLGAVIARATQPRAEARFADADAMLRALEEAAATMGASAGTAARELAAWLAERCPAAPEPLEPIRDDGADAALTDETTGGERGGAEGRETYFRDARTEGSFEEELLRDGDPAPPPPTAAPPAASPPSPSRRPPVGALALGALAIAGAITVAAIALVARVPGTTAAPLAPHRPTPTAPEHTAAPPAPAPTPTPPPSASPTPAPAPAPAPAPTATPTSPTPRRPASRADGTLHILCTPWCVAFVDGRTTGEDAKDHRLTLPAGRHRLAAQRLDDRQERVVDLRPDESRTIEFTFP
jgi:serine/threonine protein kinase